MTVGKTQQRALQNLIQMCTTRPVFYCLTNRIKKYIILNFLQRCSRRYAISQSLSNEHLFIRNILRKWTGESTPAISSKDFRGATLGFARFARKSSFRMWCSAATRFSLRTVKLSWRTCSRSRRILKSNSSNWLTRADECGDNDMLLLMSSLQECEYCVLGVWCTRVEYKYCGMMLGTCGRPAVEFVIS